MKNLVKWTICVRKIFGVLITQIRWILDGNYTIDLSVIFHIFWFIILFRTLLSQIWLYNWDKLKTIEYVVCFHLSYDSFNQSFTLLFFYVVYLLLSFCIKFFLYLKSFLHFEINLKVSQGGVPTTYQDLNY